MNSDHTITVMNTMNEPVLIIEKNGRIKFNGPPDEASRIFLNCFQNIIDTEMCATRKLYDLINVELSKILMLIEGMSKEQIIQHIQNLRDQSTKHLTWYILQENIDQPLSTI